MVDCTLFLIVTNLILTLVLALASVGPVRSRLTSKAKLDLFVSPLNTVVQLIFALSLTLMVSLNVSQKVETVIVERATLFSQVTLQVCLSLVHLFLDTNPAYRLVA